MITLIEVLDYRCLRYIQQPLDSFHVLVGPNASGKTTFLDVVSFLGRLVADGLDAAIDERTKNFQDLVWGRSGGGFELAIEARIPEDRREKLEIDSTTIRYEVSIRVDPETGEPVFESECVGLKGKLLTPSARLSDFPLKTSSPATILEGAQGNPSTRIVSMRKNAGGSDSYQPENSGRKEGRPPIFQFKLGRTNRRSAICPKTNLRFRPRPG